MTKVLIAYAGKHGSTMEIAQTISSVLSDLRYEVDICSVAHVQSPGQYDAFILGSAVYASHLMSDWEGFIRDNLALLQQRPVWLFSTGPIGSPPFPSEQSPRLAELAALVGAREHRLFGGRLGHDLSFAEHLAVRIVGAEEGDYRDWNQVVEWAGDIGATLLGLTTVTQPA